MKKQVQHVILMMPYPQSVQLLGHTCLGYITNGAYGFEIAPFDVDKDTRVRVRRTRSSGELIGMVDIPAATVAIQYAPEPEKMPDEKTQTSGDQPAPKKRRGRPPRVQLAE